MQIELTSAQIQQIVYCMEQMHTDYDTPGADRDDYYAALDVLVDAMEEELIQDDIEPDYIDDCFDDAQALASAGWGTDEDY